MLLFITEAGLDAIGVDHGSEPEKVVDYRSSEGTNSAGEPAVVGTGAPRESRDGTK